MPQASIVEVSEYFTADMMSKYSSDMSLTSLIPRPDYGKFLFPKKWDTVNKVELNEDDKSQILLRLANAPVYLKHFPPLLIFTRFS